MFKNQSVYSYCSLTHDIIRLPVGLSENIKNTAKKFFPNFANWKIKSPTHSNQASIISMDCVCGMVYYHSIAGIIREKGGIPLYPIRYENGWEHRRIVYFDDDTSKIIDAIREKIIEENTPKKDEYRKDGIEKSIFEVKSINNFGDEGLYQAQSFFLADVLEDLSMTQKQVFIEAYKAGYYEIPRRSTLEDLAENLGKSHQAVNKSLRLAENKMIHFFAPFLLLDEDDQTKS